MIADLEKSYNALSDIKAENDILALENSRIKSKIDFLYTIEGAENNNNFLISFKHSVKKVSTNSIDINSSNGGASAFISQPNVSISGLAPHGGIVRHLCPMLKRWPMWVMWLSEKRFLFLNL